MPPEAVVHYNHYHNPAHTDLALIKKEAEFRFNNGGWISVVHHHRHLEDCRGECEIIRSHTHKPDCRRDCDYKSEWILTPFTAGDGIRV